RRRSKGNLLVEGAHRWLPRCRAAWDDNAAQADPLQPLVARSAMVEQPMVARTTEGRRRRSDDRPQARGRGAETGGLDGRGSCRAPGHLRERTRTGDRCPRRAGMEERDALPPADA